ncbi:MAG TPA: hypothetical protein VF516_46970 [Kofleriaceae bacterium]
MRRDLFPALMSLATLGAALGGCRGGAGVGHACGSNDDCDGSLQCVNDICVPRCERAPECGDGYACVDGLCVVAHGHNGDNCLGESDCAAGLTCQINGAEVDPMTNRLIASCSMENAHGSPAGEACGGDDDCRNGACELGHCVDLCHDITDCAGGTKCMTIPRVAVNGELFEGCLPAQGTVSWKIPVVSPSAQILLPVPSEAASAELVMSVDDPGQKVGVTSVLDPCGCTRYNVPCSFLAPGDPTCTDLLAADQFYSRDPDDPGSVPVSRGITGDAASNVCGSPATCNPGGRAVVNHFRHIPAFGRSVLLMPSIPHNGELTPGAYQIQVSSFWPDNSPGSAVPHVTAVIRIGTGNMLDLHFFFLDLEDHPCTAMTGTAALSAGTAKAPGVFQTDYLGELSRIFGRVGLGVNADYHDITDRHALDGLDVADLGSLFTLDHTAAGINVFFVRSLSPVGVEVSGPNPGPAGVGGTAASGIAISLDTLCYRDWPAIARLTAHAIGHYMGLFHNVEPPDPVQGPSDPPWQDLAPDTDASNTNLMYFSQLHAGSDITVDQTYTLSRSPVLR